MKKYLMGLSLIIFCANAQGEVINLGKQNIYSTTGYETNLRNTTSSPYIITSKDIETKGYTSVSEVLASVPGVNVQEGALPAVDVRGQGYQKAKATVQLLVDGVLINMLDTSHLNVPINVVNVDEIERVEIIPGGAAVLYGSGTSGGVINIITKRYKGNDKDINFRGGVGYQVGSYANNKFDVSAGTSAGKFDFDVNYSKNRKHGYRDYDFTNSDYFAGRINYNINDTDNLAVKYSGYRDKYTYPQSLTKEQVEKDRRQSGVTDDVNEKNRIKRDEFTLTYNNKLGSSNDLNILGYYQKTNITSDSISDGTGMYKGMTIGMLKGQMAGMSQALNNPALPRMAKTAIQNKINALSKQIGQVAMSNETVDFANHSKFEDTKKTIKIKDKFTYDANGSNLIFGLGYTQNDMKRQSKMDFVGKMNLADTKLNLTKKTFETFALNTYKVDKFEFSQGLRYEKSKYNGDRKNVTDSLSINKSMNNWAGNLGINYLYSDTGNVYVKYERAFTSPAPAQLVDKVKVNSRVFAYEVNNLKSEKTNQFELGWNDYFANSLLSADVYYSETKDEIATVFEGGTPNPHNTAFSTTNIGKTRRYGFDFAAEQKFEKLTLKESYSFINAKIKKSSTKEQEGKYIMNVPKHKLMLSADYEILPKFTVGADYEYRVAAFIDNTNKEGKDKAKSVFNLRADYKINDSLNVYAGVNNVFGAKYYESVGVNSYDPAARRNYYTGFKYKF